MAIVSAGFELEVEFVDTGANKTTRTYGMTALTYEDATTESEDAIEKLDPITEATISGWRLVEVFADNVPIVLPADAEIEKQALLVFTPTGDPLKRVTQTIPAPANGIFQGPSGPQYNKVDPADADLIAWWGLFTTGGTLTMRNQQTVDTFVEGNRISRASNRG